MSTLNSSLKRAVIYARYSSDMQTENSIEAQKMAIEKYAANNGFQIVGEYIDRAKSGMTTKGRSEFLRMIADSATDEFNYVIVHKMDRFARNINDATTYIAEMARNDVMLVSVLEPTSDTPEGIIFSALYAAMAEYYSRNLSREVMKGMMVKANKCEHTGGIPPLGYDVDYKTKKLVINEHEAKAVTIIYDRFLAGYSYSEIAEELNSLGYRSKIGRRFNKNSFYDIIRNKKYCGYYIYNRASGTSKYGKRNNHKNKSPEEIISFKGGMPAIISEETYDKAMKKMESNRGTGGKYYAKHTYLLSGLVKCGVCGCNMTGSSRKGGTGHYTNSYRCKHTKAERCGNKEIKQEAIEEFVLSELEKHVFSEDKIPVILNSLREHYARRTESEEAELKHIDRMFSHYETRKNNIAKAIANGVDSDIFKEELYNISVDIEKLNERKEKLNKPVDIPEITEETLREAIRKFSEAVRNRDMPECKKFIADYVKEVVVYSDRVEVALRVTSSSLCNYVIVRNIARRFLPKLRVYKIKEKTADSNNAISRYIYS